MDESNSDLRDEELPDEADCDTDDAVAHSFDLEPCIFCGEPIYEDADICYHCGSYVGPEAKSRRSRWLIVFMIALTAALLLGVVLAR